PLSSGRARGSGTLSRRADRLLLQRNRYAQSGDDSMGLRDAQRSGRAPRAAVQGSGMDIVSGQGPTPVGDAGNAHLEARDALQRSSECDSRDCRQDTMTTNTAMKWLAGLALAALVTTGAVAQSDFPNR